MDQSRFNDIDYTEKNSDYNRVKNFTFVKPMSPKVKIKNFK